MRPIIFSILKKQQNIFFMFAIAGATVISLFVFIYAPMDAHVKRLRSELKAVEDSLNKIHKIVGTKEDIGKGIIKLREEALTYQHKFINPENASELLKTLSDQAREYELDVVSIQPSDFRLCYDEKGTLLKFDGLECNKISIDMSVTGSYGAFVDYMQGLENDSQAQLIVERFGVDEQSGTDKLKARIVINAFAFMPPRKK